MPSRAPNRKKNIQNRQKDGVTLQLPRKLLEPLGELLQELTLSKRKEREDKEKDKKTKSAWERFWTWWKDYGEGAVKILTIISALVGGLWTLNQYIVQEKEKVAQQAIQEQEKISQQATQIAFDKHQAEIERQALIAQFASELSDPTKRNTSSYAFALLAGDDAIPLLTSELVSAAKFDLDNSYQDALIRSLVQIGDSALLPVVEINRQAVIKNDEQNDKIIRATQPFLYQYLYNKTNTLVGKNKILAGIHIDELNLSYKDFSGVDFSKVKFISTNLCMANFNNGDFQSLDFDYSDIGGANFENSQISGIELDETTPGTEANFDNTQINWGNFQGAHLPKTTWKGAKITRSYLEVALLEYANFDGAVIESTSLLQSKFFGASFKNAQFIGGVFWGSDLENADFSGAVFSSDAGIFGHTQDDIPSLIVEIREKKVRASGGAFVRGANFENVTGLSENSRIYLCTWGAINVPGGCTGIKVRTDDMLIVPTERSTQYEWCY